MNPVHKIAFEEVEDYLKVYTALVDTVSITGAVIVVIDYSRKVIEIAPHPFTTITGGQIELDVGSDIIKITATHKAWMHNVDFLTRAFVLSKKLGILAFMAMALNTRRMQAVALIE
jgi:hypothetical protein